MKSRDNRVDLLFSSSNEHNNNNRDEPAPRTIQALEGLKIETVWAGPRMSMFVTKSGEVSEAQHTMQKLLIR